MRTLALVAVALTACSSDGSGDADAGLGRRYLGEWGVQLENAQCSGGLHEIAFRLSADDLGIEVGWEPEVNEIRRVGVLEIDEQSVRVRVSRYVDAESASWNVVLFDDGDAFEVDLEGWLNLSCQVETRIPKVIRRVRL